MSKNINIIRLLQYLKKLSLFDVSYDVYKKLLVKKEKTILNNN